MFSVSGAIKLLNRLFDAIAIYNAQQELAEAEQRRKQVQDDPINEFESMFGPAINDDANQLRKPSTDKTVRTDSTTIELGKK